MFKRRIVATIVILLGVLIAYFVYNTEVKNPGSKYAFSLGLDLSGGTHLVYRADVSQIDSGNVKESMSALRDVIERRVNLFGVSETNVQVEDANFANSRENRIIVDLPGVTDVQKAIEMIGETPVLEFRTVNPDYSPTDLDAEALESQNTEISPDLPEPFLPTELTGRYLKRARLDFPQSANQAMVTPTVVLEFDKDGAVLFEKITEENLGKIVAIYLDGYPISAPVVQGVISGGEAVISGNFTAEEAKLLVGRLNSGALPVPIELVSTQTIGPSLGVEATNAGVFAGFVGFVILSVLLIIWYRFPGIVAVIALLIYIALMCALMKIIPITLTAAGIAGFVISLGLAVDGNILISERLKEEIRGGRTIGDAIKVGFSRAWTSIRDSNTSSVITAVILFWFGSSLVQGFALTLGLGSIVSMLSAVTVTRIILLAFNFKDSKFMKFMFKSGFAK
ncbi:protein translocase subunit SecD [Candidatus Nomurabacteria bacterium]|nr:protein translocase subunit SecD [Candidatus Nomurabacteria bacterium]